LVFWNSGICIFFLWFWGFQFFVWSFTSEKTRYVLFFLWTLKVFILVF
jgi:hypothetical protein